MSGTALGLVLAAAVLHAGWNAFAKRGRDQFCFLWSAVTVAAVLFAPATVFGLVGAGLPAPALPFVAATVALHAVYFYTLGRSYQSGEFSLVYPIARGLGVALVPVLAFPLLGERLSPLGATGIVLVVGGIVALQLGGVSWTRLVGQLRHAGPGTWWAVVTGLTIAGYALVDKAGVARLHPVPYIGLMFAGSSVLLAPAALRARTALAAEWRRSWAPIVVAAAMTLTAYLLVLFAFRLSKAGYVVAARESSIVISVVLGRVWFAESAWRARLGGATLILAGVACVALAR